MSTAAWAWLVFGWELAWDMWLGLCRELGLDLEAYLADEVS